MMYEDFRDLRETIESLIKGANDWADKKSISESSIRFDKAKELFPGLKSMVANDVQKRTIDRLSFDFSSLEKKIEQILTKRDAGKKQDGNIAFKCNWNDRYYKAPCSDEAYSYNLIEGRAWCSHPLNKCRTYTSGVTLEENPCYESITLKESYFGAGWDLNGEKIEYRHIRHARSKRMAILTTRLPWSPENKRIVVGCFLIDSVVDDPDAETKIYGDKTKSLEIDYDRIKIYFWDYYKNPDAENKIFWGTGLYRYVSNITVLNMLKDIGEKYVNAGCDVKMVMELVRYYENLTRMKSGQLGT